MLKAYIIRSRVKEVSDIIVAQPYNPHLLRQGIQPGPQLLLDILLGRITTVEASINFIDNNSDIACLMYRF